MERKISKQQILAELTRSSHSALNDYLAVGLQAAKEDPEFLAHLISWNRIKGQVRDSQVALPVISLASPAFRDEEFIDNSLAHLAKLTPRQLYQAYRFACGYVRNKGEKIESVLISKEGQSPRYKVVKSHVGGWKRFTPKGKSLLGPAGRMNAMNRLITRYLQSREQDEKEFQANLLNFRQDIVRLYSATQTPMSALAQAMIVHKTYPAGSALMAVQNLPRMSAKEAAAAIVQFKLPFLSLFPILKEKAKDPVLLMAIIDQMSPTELQSNMKYLERMGVNDHAETRAALESALLRMATSRKTTLKTAKAVEAVQDQALKSKLEEVQKKQVKNIGGLDGNWLVLGDCSGSMSRAVETAKLIAGYLSGFVKGEVALAFFNNEPRYFDVTGRSLAEIKDLTRRIVANGGTSIGCGLRAARDKKFDVQGIVIVSDGEENSAPRFVDQYAELRKELERDIPVYYFRMEGGYNDTLAYSMAVSNFDMEVRDLRGVPVDEYSIPNFVQTMRVNRYSVIDEVLETRLLTLDKVLREIKTEEEFATCS